MMPLSRVEQTRAVLAPAAAEILERMFFWSVEDVDAVPEDASPEPALASEIWFHGAHSGWLRLVVPGPCALDLAANFTGISDSGQLDREHVAEVLRELTNMMCGTTLSRLAPQAVFDLDPPALLAPDAVAPADADPNLLACRLKSGNDWIGLYWRWEEAT